MSNYGLKISKDGKSTDSTDPRDYVIWSKYKNPKTYIVGTASFNITDESFSQSDHTIATITHNLGYKPVVYFYWSTGGNYGQESWIASQASPHICWELISYNVTTTTLNLNYWYFPSMTGDNITGLGGTNFSFKYYIMIDRT